jgi:hypothetical protein
MKKFLMGGVAAVAIGGFGAITSAPASATVSQAICPHTVNTNASSTPFPNCNEVIHFNANGSISTTVPLGATTNYDGSDDNLVGVVNSTAHAITSFSLSSARTIFGFDGDGIDTYTHIGPVAGNPDTTGYGGPDASFSGINAAKTSGIVTFNNGGITPGATDYFSLEEPVSLSKPLVIGTPEPAALATLGVGLVGLAMMRRRRRKS